ncbi:MAG: n-acetylglutamate synthase [Ferruginibacter sp.]|nr:n-acetylglutamate synthase [Cytophagales bacterium]
MSFNYHNRTFRSVNNTGNGEVDAETTFHYRQAGGLVWATYEGGRVVYGNLLAKVDEAGRLDMRYQHLNVHGELMTGQCLSVPERLPDGRIRLHETWQWTSGDRSSGQSIIEEVK